MFKKEDCGDKLDFHFSCNDINNTDFDTCDGNQSLGELTEKLAKTITKNTLNNNEKTPLGPITLTL